MTSETTRLTDETVEAFGLWLRRREKSAATQEKYRRAAAAFRRFCGDGPLSKETVLAYKQSLLDGGGAVRSVNAALAALNSLFAFLDRPDCRVRAVRIQRQLYRPAERELTRAEYERLCRAAEARGDRRLALMLQTLCGTGIRVSELAFVTVEAAAGGEAEVLCKAKERTVFLVKALRKKLLRYAAARGIVSGPVFVTKSGRPVDRTAVWRAMKSLCAAARVDPRKAFPHNLRHLFARAFYAARRDLAKLADLLGHSSIETTRIYVASTGVEHRRELERLRLVL